MKKEIKVPPMGESITEATVGAFIKPHGSRVSADEELIELETDKVNQVLYAPDAGVVEYIVKPDQVVKIGEVIGYVDTAGAEAKQEQPKEQPVEKVEKEKPASEPVQKPIGQVRKGKEEFIADVKEMAPEQPILKEIPKAPTTASRTETRRKMSKIRRVIANRLVEVQKTTAMLTTFNEVDMTEVMNLREKYKELFAKTHNSKLGFMSFFVKASVYALQQFPDVNSYIDGEEIVQRQYYDIGIAVGTEKGLFVPVVRNCEQLTFAGVESAIEGFAKKAREGGLSVDDLQGGGFTITNGGVYGSLLSTPILNPPQSAILGMHKIEKRAVVIKDQVVIRPMMYLALSYDHRIIDGKEAVTFLVTIKNMLEDPSRLLLEI